MVRRTKSLQKLYEQEEERKRLDSYIESDDLVY